MTVITAHEQLEGGGFLVHRPFPSMALPDMDPFLLLDQMGPVDHGPREAVGAPDHPHRGFETVTYMLDGAMEHRDSHGNHGRLGPGDVQWMTAGSGVIHSELPEKSFYERGGRMHGIQLWVNLPAAHKMMAPRYQDIPAARIPSTQVGASTVRVISGKYGDVEAVIDTVIPIQYLHITLDGALPIDIPAGHNGFVYVLSGRLKAGGEDAHDHQLVRLAPGRHDVDGAGDLLVLSGPPLREPVARYGPFVMNTREEIYQAVRDFQAGRFGSIPATMEHGAPRVVFVGTPAFDVDGADGVEAHAGDESAVRNAKVVVVGSLDKVADARLRKAALIAGAVVVEAGPDAPAAVAAALA